MRHTELIQRLSRLAGFPDPDPAREQVETPAEAAAELLESALARGELAGCTVADLGCGTGRLAIGAAMLGAATVRGIDSDAAALDVARSNAARAGVEVHFELRDVAGWAEPVDTIVMNPPFGAQRRGADRPFWEAAFLSARRAVHAFALADSRSFIAARAVARGARIVETRPGSWRLPATFPHHRKRAVELPVDRWVFDTRRAQ